MSGSTGDAATQQAFWQFSFTEIVTYHRARARTILCAICFFLFLIAGCAEAPAEQAIRARISAMQLAIEGKNLDDFMLGVDPQFSANQESLDRRKLRLMLQLHLMRYKNIDAKMGPIEIKIIGDRAEVKFDLLATGGNWIPEHADHLRVKSIWIKRSSKWSVVEASWEY